MATVFVAACGTWMEAHARVELAESTVVAVVVPMDTTLVVLVVHEAPSTAGTEFSSRGAGAPLAICQPTTRATTATRKKNGSAAHRLS